MTTDRAENALDVLTCDIEARPAGAPGPAAVAHALLSIERTAAALVLSFDPAARQDVERFVAAERKCCSGLSWQVEPARDATRVRVGAAPQQLDVLEQLFTQLS